MLCLELPPRWFPVSIAWAPTVLGVAACWAFCRARTSILIPSAFVCGNTAAIGTREKQRLLIGTRFEIYTYILQSCFCWIFGCALILLKQHFYWHCPTFPSYHTGGSGHFHRPNKRVKDHQNLEFRCERGRAIPDSLFFLGGDDDLDGRSNGNSHAHHLFIYILHKTRYIYTYIHRFDTHLHAFVDQGIFPFRPSIGHFITLTTTVRPVMVRKGNYTLLARKMAAAVGWERVYMQPFDLFLGSLKKRLSEGVGGQRSWIAWRFGIQAWAMGHWLHPSK